MRFTVWFNDQHDLFVLDNDFGYDAQLQVTGDFTRAEARRYAEAVAEALNAADIPRRA